MPASTPLSSDPIAEAKRHWLSHGWQEAADGMAAVTSLMRAQQLVLGRVESTLKPFGLSFARFEMLTLLSFTKDGQLPMASAGAMSVTNTVDRLERDGLVTRSAHPTDGRATIVTITPAGREIVAKASPALNSTVFEQPGMSQQDLSDLVRILARFRRQAGDFIDPPTPPDPL